VQRGIQRDAHVYVVERLSNENLDILGAPHGGGEVRRDVHGHVDISALHHELGVAAEATARATTLASFASVFL
jgi:hypothetical protein